MPVFRLIFVIFQCDNFMLVKSLKLLVNGQCDSFIKNIHFVTLLFQYFSGEF